MIQHGSLLMPLYCIPHTMAGVHGVFSLLSRPHLILSILFLVKLLILDLWLSLKKSVGGNAGNISQKGTLQQF